MLSVASLEVGWDEGCGLLEMAADSHYLVKCNSKYYICNLTHISGIFLLYMVELVVVLKYTHVMHN